MDQFLRHNCPPSNKTAVKEYLCKLFGSIVSYAKKSGYCRNFAEQKEKGIVSLRFTVGRSGVMEDAASANLMTSHSLVSIANTYRDTVLIIAYDYRIFAYHILV